MVSFRSRLSSILLLGALLLSAPAGMASVRGDGAESLQP
jgi:hypothetical protein